MKVFDNMAFGLKLAKERADLHQGAARRQILGLTEISTAIRGSFLAASASGWPWAGRLFATRRSSCSTSRYPIWMPRCACRCARRSRLHQRLGSTTIYVTHDQIEAMTMADIVVMRDGRIEQVGRAARALRPAREPLRGRLHWLPAMNLIAGTLRGKDTSRHVETNDGAMLPVSATRQGGKVSRSIMAFDPTISRSSIGRLRSDRRSGRAHGRRYFGIRLDGKEKSVVRSRSAMVSGRGNASPSRHASTVCISSTRNPASI